MYEGSSDIFPTCFKLKSLLGDFVIQDGKILESIDQINTYDVVGHYYNEEYDLNLFLIEKRDDLEDIDSIIIVLKAFNLFMYKYLVDRIESRYGMTIILTHSYGQTSDLILISNRFGEDTLISVETMANLINIALEDPYKYIEIHNTKIKHIYFDDMFIRGEEL